MNRAVHADQDGELDRARGVEPAIAGVVEIVSCGEVADGHTERSGAGRRLELGETCTELGR